MIKGQPQFGCRLYKRRETVHTQIIVDVLLMF